MAKGVAAVLVARRFDAPPLVVGTAAVTVVLGHVFPVFLGFRGGKGVATAAGALGALAPAVMAVALLLFFLIVSWKRYVSLGSIAVAALFPLLAWIGDRLGWVEEGGPWLVLSSGAIGAIILARHASNLRRLIHGTERRLGESRVRPAGKEG
ncbi:MAG TPA: glycerol-3-phosphate acyltransferase [Thermoanaerobaculia bacterium]|nr:glycerol-3-phosphate acyltransferase [Thermoanaerobaculia bacterium]